MNDTAAPYPYHEHKRRGRRQPRQNRHFAADSCIIFRNHVPLAVQDLLIRGIRASFTRNLDRLQPLPSFYPGRRLTTIWIKKKKLGYHLPRYFSRVDRLPRPLRTPEYIRRNIHPRRSACKQRDNLIRCARGAIGLLQAYRSEDYLRRTAARRAAIDRLDENRAIPDLRNRRWSDAGPPRWVRPLLDTWQIYRTEENRPWWRSGFLDDPDGRIPVGLDGRPTRFPWPELTYGSDISSHIPSSSSSEGEVDEDPVSISRVRMEQVD